MHLFVAPKSSDNGSTNEEMLAAQTDTHKKKQLTLFAAVTASVNVNSDYMINT